MWAALTRIAPQLRHGIFKSEATVRDIDEIVAARFVDKRGKLREELERNWQELTINVDALIVSADLKVENAAAPPPQLLCG